MRIWLSDDVLGFVHGVDDERPDDVGALEDALEDAAVEVGDARTRHEHVEPGVGDSP
jgi:hypothetical protein